MTFTWDDSVLAEPIPEPPQPVPNADKSWVTTDIIETPTPEPHQSLRRDVFLVVCAVLGAAVIGTAAGLLFYDKGNTQNQDRLTACSTAISLGQDIQTAWNAAATTITQAGTLSLAGNYPASSLTLADAKNQIDRIERNTVRYEQYALVCQGRK